MIQVGDKAPDIDLRTLAGTPISLSDLKGRAVIVFLLGGTMAPAINSLLTALTEHTDRFLDLDISPIAVLTKPEEQLGNYPQATSAPYLIMVDHNLSLHEQFQGIDGKEVSVWLIDEHSVVIDTIPVLPPVELVRLSAERARKIHRRTVSNENETVS